MLKLECDRCGVLKDLIGIEQQLTIPPIGWYNIEITYQQSTIKSPPNFKRFNICPTCGNSFQQDWMQPKKYPVEVSNPCKEVPIREIPIFNPK